MSKNILITGASGFIGANLVRDLLDKGHNIFATTSNSGESWRLKDIRRHIYLQKVDIRDRNSLQDIVNWSKPDIIYHLATLGSYHFHTINNDILTTNIIGTNNLLEASAWIDYEMFVNVGSSSEYGHSDSPMREDDRLNPYSCYGVAKAAQTNLCQYYAKKENKPVCTIRPFSVYGPFEESTRLVYQVITRTLKEQLISITNPYAMRDFVYMQDVIDALNMTDQLVSGEIYNLGSGESTKIEEIAKIVIKLTGLKPKCPWNYLGTTPKESKLWVADNTKLKSIGWEQKFSLEEGLKKTIEWYQNESK